MDIKILEYVYTLFFFIGVCSSYADEIIRVMNTRCGSTYDIALYEKITLAYEMGESFNPNPRCVFTIVNNNTDMEICIKDLRERYTWRSKLDCQNTFRYFIGHLSSHSYMGYTCSDLKQGPMCTRKTSVYAVFWDGRMHTLNSLKVQIYWRNILEARLLARATAGGPTTPYWYSSNDDSSNNEPYPDDTAFQEILAAAITIAVVGCLILIGIAYLIYRGKIKATETTEPLPLTQQPAQYVNPPSRHPSYTEDAPSYSSVVMQQQQPTDEVNRNGQADDRVDQGEPSAPTCSWHMDENQLVPRIQLETNPTSEEQDDSQNVPSDPPPDYSDIVPPPPYPGY